MEKYKREDIKVTQLLNKVKNMIKDLIQKSQITLDYQQSRIRMTRVLEIFEMTAAIIEKVAPFIKDERKE